MSKNITNTEDLNYPEGDDSEIQIIRPKGDTSRWLSFIKCLRKFPLIFFILVLITLVFLWNKYITTPNPPITVPDPPPPEPPIIPDPDAYRDDGPIPKSTPRSFAHMQASIPSPSGNETLAVTAKYLDEIMKIDTTVDDPKRTLLIGISVGADQFHNRRELIRQWQIERFPSFPVTYMFILGDAGPKYEHQIQEENKTHGDLIVFRNFTDGKEFAISLKPFEFFEYVEKNLGMFRYVAKMDADCFLNLHDFFLDYLNETVVNLDFAMLALFIKGQAKFNWPQGGFYAISWKTLVLVNRLYEEVYRSRFDEDIQIAWYLYDAQINLTEIDLGSRAYDFYEKKDIMENAVRVHFLKDDEEYIRVANCFTPKGINMTEVQIMRNRTTF